VAVVPKVVTVLLAVVAVVQAAVARQISALLPVAQLLRSPAVCWLVPVVVVQATTVVKMAVMAVV
jgi:hypothetical protein